MKKLFLLFFLIFFSGKIFSQNLPDYYIVNKDTVGIILPIDQVKRMKNDLELKVLLEDMMISCDSTINRLIIVVDDYEKRVVSLNATITKLDSSDKNKQEIINSLKKTLKEVKKDRDFCDSISAKKDTVIQNSEIIISDLKTQRKWWRGGTFTFLVTTVLLLLLH
jgi:peptidoglycan hydrolase CwlO-like protein